MILELVENFNKTGCIKTRLKNQILNGKSEKMFWCKILCAKSCTFSDEIDSNIKFKICLCATGYILILKLFSVWNTNLLIHALSRL